MLNHSPMHPSWLIAAGLAAIVVWIVWADVDTRPGPDQAQALPNPAEQRIELLREVKAMHQTLQRIEHELADISDQDRRVPSENHNALAR